MDLPAEHVPYHDNPTRLLNIPSKMRADEYCDDSYLSSLSDEENYHSGNGREMDDDDEDSGVTFDFSASTQ
ncbi:hypothetical protein TNCV_2310441 [Trichonephila clavipes]|nr:hypothetical protein TNCV_2310441 [Trichonephila clavipes]